MPKRSRKTKTQKPQDKSKNYVAVTYADDVEQAREYEALLKTNDIPVAIRKHNNSDYDEDRDFAITVPENFLDEAYAIIESQDVYDDDYDNFALEDDEDLELNPDLLDDDNF